MVEYSTLTIASLFLVLMLANLIPLQFLITNSSISSKSLLQKVYGETPNTAGYYDSGVGTSKDNQNSAENGDNNKKTTSGDNDNFKDKISNINGDTVNRYNYGTTKHDSYGLSSTTSSKSESSGAISSSNRNTFNYIIPRDSLSADDKKQQQVQDRSSLSSSLPQSSTCGHQIIDKPKCPTVEPVIRHPAVPIRDYRPNFSIHSRYGDMKHLTASLAKSSSDHPSPGGQNAFNNDESIRPHRCITRNIDLPRCPTGASASATGQSAAGQTSRTQQPTTRFLIDKPKLEQIQTPNTLRTDNTRKLPAGVQNPGDMPSHFCSLAGLQCPVIKSIPATQATSKLLSIQPSSRSIAQSAPTCQISDLKRMPWTYYAHCDVLNSDGSISAHCEVNSKYGGEGGFTSVFACQTTPSCGHYWIHSDGSIVEDSGYPRCSVKPSGPIRLGTYQQGVPPTYIVGNPPNHVPPLSLMTQKNIEQFKKEICSPGNSNRDLQINCPPPLFCKYGAIKWSIFRTCEQIYPEYYGTTIPNRPPSPPVDEGRQEIDFFLKQCADDLTYRKNQDSISQIEYNEAINFCSHPEQAIPQPEQAIPETGGPSDDDDPNCGLANTCHIHCNPDFQSCYPDTLLPLSKKGDRSDGYYNIMPQFMEFGTKQTIETILRIGREWANTHSDDPEIGITSISLPGGGIFPPHKSHQSGWDVDIRPMSIDGGPTTWESKNYDQQLTRDLINIIKENGNVDKIFFNDKDLISEGLVRWQQGHDNHLHVRFKP